MKKILLLLLPIALSAKVHYAKVEPIETATIKSSVSGIVVRADQAAEGSVLGDEAFVQIDDALDRENLKDTEASLELMKESLDINQEILQGLKTSLERQKGFYERMNGLETTSQTQKDNAWNAYIGAKNQYLGTREKIISLKKTILDLGYKMEMLKDVITPEMGDDYELVEWINNATDRATKVVRGLLDFARQSSYNFQLGQVETSIESTIELVAYQMRKGNVEIVREYGEDLPQVMASWEHLKTVWLNILLNARDALENREGDRQVRIVTRVSANGEYVQVLFNDNGVGIAEQQLAHIFEPFFTTKDPGKGTGLGLATSHRIIDRHAAEISVTSELGTGTTFLISLPVSETAHLAAEKEPVPVVGVG